MENKALQVSFAQNQVSYLDHVISEQGVATIPSKISDIATWPSPQNTKDLRSFLGMASYYRKFMRHFGIISQPLNILLKKGSMFIWTAVHEKAFQTLKQALMTIPVLALPDFIKPFIIETDASEMGVGAVLMQGGHPLAFLSKDLGPKSKGLSTYEKEYMAILVVVQYGRAYL
jgi:hypothetical protein